MVSQTDTHLVLLGRKPVISIPPSFEFANIAPKEVEEAPDSTPRVLRTWCSGCETNLSEGSKTSF